MVDVKSNPALETLYCNNVAIGELNIVNNTQLTKLECHTNADLTTLTCYNDFDFTNTFVSLDKGVDIINVAGERACPEVGDLIEVNGGIGVVFNVSNESFKIISIEETTAKWGPKNYTTNAANYDNGAENMATIKSIDSSLSNYPAFKWCDEYGTDWYLPSIHELNAISKIRSTINSTLNANNCTTLGTGYYWSSTEYSGNYAFCTNFSSGYNYNESKSYTYNVRAILAF